MPKIDQTMTCALREFMARTGQPVACFDLHEHEATICMMIRFGIAPDEVPAVVTIDGVVVKNPSTRQVADATGISADSLDGKQSDGLSMQTCLLRGVKLIGRATFEFKLCTMCRSTFMEGDKHGFC